MSSEAKRGNRTEQFCGFAELASKHASNTTNIMNINIIHIKKHFYL